MRTRIILVSLALVFVLVAASGLSAQTFRGTILGTVTDPSGAVLAGAKVTVKNTGTGLERTTETSADGSYSLPELPIGTYTVTVTQTGFQTFVATGVTVDVATERRVDAAMKTGADLHQGRSLRRPVAHGRDHHQYPRRRAHRRTIVKNLPINGRDYTKLIFLNPGVAGSPDQITDSPGSFGEFSMNGARGRSNNYLLDGTDMNDGYRNDPAINQGGVFGTPSAILAHRCRGRHARALELRTGIRTQRRRHGQHRDQERHQRHPRQLLRILPQQRSGCAQLFRSVAICPKAPFHNNQFGGSLGGPIVKDKTFFYLDYEGQRENVGVVSLDCVPTLAHIAQAEANIATGGGAVSPVGAAIANFFPTIPAATFPASHRTMQDASMPTLISPPIMSRTPPRSTT